MFKTRMEKRLAERKKRKKAMQLALNNMIEAYVRNKGEADNEIDAFIQERNRWLDSCVVPTKRGNDGS